MPKALIGSRLPSLVVCAALAGAALGCDEPQAPTAPTAKAVSIRGRTLDYRTQAGISGAEVEFAGIAVSGVGRATSDANGSYVMSLPGVGTFAVSVNGARIGTAQVTGSAYRGDLLLDADGCQSRYGTLVDARTQQPIARAAVSFGGEPMASSDDEGWYRLDLGCASAGPIPSNTSFVYVTHPRYRPLQQVVGRGVQAVQRLDLELARR